METNETFVNVEPSADPERVGFGKRFGAYLIDFILAGIIGGFVGARYGDQLASMFYGNEMNEAMGEIEAAGLDGFEGIMEGMMGTIASISLVVFVIMLLDAFLGQTIGKMILGVKNGSEDGSNASLSALILRAIIKYINTVLSLLAIITSVEVFNTIGGFMGFAVFIGFFFVLGEKKQGFHDMIAKTAVFNKSDLDQRL